MDNLDQQLYKVTHIGRILDPRYPTNLAIMIWMGVVGAAIFGIQLINGTEVIQAGISGVIALFSVFFAWAMSRELDPQHQLSAFVSALLMTIAVFLVDVRFNLIILFYMMSMLRIVNRSTGLPALLTDSLVMVVLTALVAFFGSWIYAMIGATAFLLDAVLAKPHRQHVIFAGLSIVIMIVTFILQNAQLVPIPPTTDYMIGILFATFIVVPLILKSKDVNVDCDITGEPMIPIRLQAGQVLMLLLGYHVAIWQGNAGILDLLPMWVSILGISLFPLIKPFLPKQTD